MRPELLAHARDHVLGRAVADDREHRIDRNHAADEERDREQPEVGEQDDDDEPPDELDAAPQAGASAPARRHLRGLLQRPPTVLETLNMYVVSDVGPIFKPWTSLRNAATSVCW